MRAATGEVDPSGLDLDEEQNVVAAQERGFCAGWEQPACRGEEGAVTRSQPWVLDLAA